MFSRIKHLLGLGGAKTRVKRVTAAPLNHPLLGSLAPDKTFGDTLLGHVRFKDGSIGISISPDGKPIDEAISLMTQAVSSLGYLDKECRRLITEEFLELYNSEWRIAQRLNSGGRIEDFEIPRLSDQEFGAKLMLQSVEASGDSLLIFNYDDSGMFAGNCLSVASFDGIVLKDIHVSMDD
jgi:hypothetical protein